MDSQGGNEFRVWQHAVFLFALPHQTGQNTVKQSSCLLCPVIIHAFPENFVHEQRNIRLLMDGSNADEGHLITIFFRHIHQFPIVEGSKVHTGSTLVMPAKGTNPKKRPSKLPGCLARARAMPSGITPARSELSGNGRPIESSRRTGADQALTDPVSDVICMPSGVTVTASPGSPARRLSNGRSPDGQEPGPR